MALSWEHDDGIRVTTRRSRIVKVDDSGTQQLVDLKILKNELPKKIWRVMEFGHFSVPPQDTDGVVIQMGSRSDRTLYIDGGHKDYRPTNRPAGSSGLFDQYGNLIQSDQDQLAHTHNKKIILQLGKGYDAKGASDYSGQTASIEFDSENSMILTYGNSTVTIRADGHIIAQGAAQFSGGVGGGRWVVVRPGRVDLGVMSPDGEAIPQVETTAGPSSIVYAEVS